MLPPVREEERKSSSRSHRRGRGVIVADRLGVTVAVIATAIKTEFVVALAAVVAIDIAVNIAIVAQARLIKSRKPRNPSLQKQKKQWLSWTPRTRSVCRPW